MIYYLNKKIQNATACKIFSLSKKTMKGLSSLIFVIGIIVIIFLVFQVSENSKRCKESRVSNQDKISECAKLGVQSATQHHFLFAYEHAHEAKLIFDNVVNQYGGLNAAEKSLKMPQGRMESLRESIYLQFEDTQTNLMKIIISQYPDFNITLNEDARLMTKTKKRKAHKRNTKEN
jgi:hypothetical protein